MTWGIHQTANIEIHNVIQQSSIYWATDQSLREDQQAEYLQFNWPQGPSSYYTALSILRKIGWSPTVIYDAPLFPKIEHGKSITGQSWTGSNRIQTNRIKMKHQRPMET